MRRLSAHRVAAVQAELIGCPDVALAVINAQLAQKLFQNTATAVTSRPVLATTAADSKSDLQSTGAILAAQPASAAHPNPMKPDRIFSSAAFMQSSDGEPVRSVIAQSPQATIVAWYIKPGQRIAAHVHPQGQDTWTILSGRGKYQLDANGASQDVVAGDVVIAHVGEVHGVLNDGTDPLVFVSVVTPLEAGFEPL